MSGQDFVVPQSFVMDTHTARHTLSVSNSTEVENKTLINISSKFVPNRSITCDDRGPPWMSKFVKNKNRKTKSIKIMLKMGEQKMKLAINDVSEIIDKRKMIIPVILHQN